MVVAVVIRGAVVFGATVFAVGTIIRGCSAVSLSFYAIPGRDFDKELRGVDKRLASSQNEEQRQTVFLSVAIGAMHRKSNGEG